MSTTETGWNEQERIRELHRLGLLDTQPEERFDRLTRLVRRLFDVPIALVSLVDTNRQWFKSHEGFEHRETPRDWSFCTHAIEHGGMLVVEDAREDPRFRDSPLVKGDPPGIRFYAGQTIRSPRGAPLGTLCIIDTEPRTLSEEDRTLLADMADLVEREFNALRLATIDDLTGLSNRRGFIMLAKQALALCQRVEKPATLLVFDLDGFKRLNDTQGHAAGDAALASFASELLASFRDSDVVARLGGDEFCVLLSGASAEDVPRTIDNLQERIDRQNDGRDPVAHLRFSVGAAAYEPEKGMGIADLLRSADARMYDHKRGGGNARS